MNANVTDYIIKFLLGESAEACSGMVGYTADVEQFQYYKVVIYPSSFFDEGIYATLASLPNFPLVVFENIPLLYGNTKVEWVGKTLVVHADVVASAYFLLSRYEEFVRRDVRDEHGRFPGKESVPVKGEFIARPIVEEYGGLLRGWLKQAGVDVTEPTNGIRRVYLTHDVDALAHYRKLRGVASAALRNRGELKCALQTFCGDINKDPWYTFPWLLECDGRICDEKRNIVFFVKPGGGKSREDAPHMNIRSSDFQSLFNLFRAKGAFVGLHASYEAGKKPCLIRKEKQVLERGWRNTICFNRHHYLGSREPEDMQFLLDAGIEEDFTMGYADVAGFRLGTCRPVRWINPLTREVTRLILHPLIVMDGTLSEPKYMGLGEEQAFAYVSELVDQTARHGGDVCLLWHNTSVVLAYHKRLYPEIIKYIAAMF